VQWCPDGDFYIQLYSPITITGREKQKHKKENQTNNNSNDKNQLN